MSYCSADHLSAHPFKPQDRKGSFTTCPTGNVPGSKKCDLKGLLFTTTSMLAQYLLFWFVVKPERPQKITASLYGTGKTVDTK